jgi:hypothetical protein
VYKLAFVVFLMLVSLVASAQQTPRASQAEAPPAAKPEDVASIDAIVTALYSVISGPAGPRDWDRFRSLFVPGAILVPTVKAPDGSMRHRVLTPEGYIERTSQVFAKEPFYETEKAKRTEQFGSIAHVFSTYESRRAPQAAPFQRGINSIELFNDGKRWWVLAILWDSERPDNPIPEKYLK